MKIFNLTPNEFSTNPDRPDKLSSDNSNIIPTKIKNIGINGKRLFFKKQIVIKIMYIPIPVPDAVKNILIGIR